MHCHTHHNQYAALTRYSEVGLNYRSDDCIGTYEVVWNASNYPSGVYFYTLTAGEYRETKKMMLVK